MVRCILSFLTAAMLSLTLIADEIGVSVNGVDISAETGDGWVYANSGLQLNGTGSFVLTGLNEDGSVSVSVNNDSTVVLSNLTLKVDKNSVCVFQISSGKNVNVQLAGINEFDSGSGNVGLLVPESSSIRISQVSDAVFGSLSAEGAAGIGATRTDCGNVFIKSGRIYAKSVSDNGAGIGGAAKRRGGGTVVISGGTVWAEGGSNAVDIGGGFGGSPAAVTITGGSVNTARGAIGNAPTNSLGAAVHCVTVTGFVANAAVDLRHIDGYGCNGIYSDAQGKAYLWLTNGVHKFQANGKGYVAEVNGGATVAQIFEENQPAGVCVDGEDIGFAGSSDGWRFDATARVLEFTGRDSTHGETALMPFRLSGTNELASLRMRCETKTALKFLGFHSEGLRMEGPFEIAGGTVALEEASGSVTIVGGSVTCGNFAVAPSNGMERVWRVTVEGLPANADVTVTELAGYGVDGLVADASGKVYLWLPNGDYIFSVNGNDIRAMVDEADVVAENLPEITPLGVSVNGIDVAYGYGLGWRYEASQLILDDSQEFTLSGTGTAGAVEVLVQADAMVTLSNLVLVTSSRAPMSIVPGCVAEVVLIGENRLQCDDDAREFAALHVPVGAGLLIRAGASFGRLVANGGRYAAGIGGGDEEGAGYIEIQSGTVEAVMGSRADFDIGGGPDGAGGEVVITGGSVKASAIDEHPVNEWGESLSCVTVSGFVPGEAVTVTGLGEYGVDGLVADEEGQIYLWLPDGAYAFNANGRRYEAVVGGESVTATDVGPAGSVVEPKSFLISSIRVGEDVIELEIATDLSSDDFAIWADGVSFFVDVRDEPGGEVVETVTPQRSGAVLSLVRDVFRTRCFMSVRAH